MLRRGLSAVCTLDWAGTLQIALERSRDLSPIGYGARKWWACPNPTSVVSEVGSEVGFWENRLISGGNNSNT